jgi:hypothetical protein
MRAPGELAGFWTRGADLDEEIAETAAEGYDVDVLLEQKADWLKERTLLFAGLDN